MMRGTEGRDFHHVLDAERFGRSQKIDLQLGEAGLIVGQKKQTRRAGERRVQHPLLAKLCRKPDHAGQRLHPVRVAEEGARRRAGSRKEPHELGADGAGTTADRNHHSLVRLHS